MGAHLCLETEDNSAKQSAVSRNTIVKFQLVIKWSKEH